MSSMIFLEVLIVFIHTFKYYHDKNLLKFYVFRN